MPVNTRGAGKPQRFGSQFDWYSGQFKPKGAGNIADIEANRRALGLMPLADYACMMNGKLKHDQRSYSGDEAVEHAFAGMAVLFGPIYSTDTAFHRGGYTLDGRRSYRCPHRCIGPAGRLCRFRVLGPAGLIYLPDDGHRDHHS